jgi:hypothetical protein
LSGVKLFGYTGLDELGKNVTIRGDTTWNVSLSQNGCCKSIGFVFARTTIRADGCVEHTPLKTMKLSNAQAHEERSAS